jgi:hypothetical protein
VNERSEHLDVAGYALGLLETAEVDLFEAHLAGCDTCARELESLQTVADLLADVDVVDLIGTEGLDPTSDTLEPISGLSAVSGTRAGNAEAASPATTPPRGLRIARSGRRQAERRRPEHLHPGFYVPEPAVPLSSRRRLVQLTAAAAFLGVLAGAGAVASAEWRNSPPAVQAISHAAGERLSATDKATGVHADAVLSSKVWGTQVSFTVSDIHGPRTCRLVAVEADGTKEVLSSWAVPAQGYGTNTQPPQLVLAAGTALPRAKIAELLIQEVASNGRATTLVTLRS